MILNDRDATSELGLETHSEKRGSGVRESAYTVSPGLPVRPEMSPTHISGPAEPRPSARSDTSLADGKEPAGLDSTVALMPSFSVASPELAPRCRSSGISTSAESTDGALGEQSVSSGEDNLGRGSTDKFYAGMRCFSKGTRSPPSPVAPAQVECLLGALEPVLANTTSPPPEESALTHLIPASEYLERSPLEYSPATPRTPVKVSLLPGMATGFLQGPFVMSTPPRSRPPTRH